MKVTPEDRRPTTPRPPAPSPQYVEHSLREADNSTRPPPKPPIPKPAPPGINPTCPKCQKNAQVYYKKERTFVDLFGEDPESRDCGYHVDNDTTKFYYDCPDREHMHLICVCGYVWFVECLDHDK